MFPTYELIASQTLGSNAASVTFDNIPQTYDDLILKYSTRSTAVYQSETWATAFFLLNAGSGDNPSRAARSLFGTGSSAVSNTDSNIVMSTGSNATANTFSSGEIYIPNYTSTTAAKSASGVATTENNGTALTWINAYIANNTATSAVTKIYAESTQGSFATGSSFYLFGIREETT